MSASRWAHRLYAEPCTRLDEGRQLLAGDLGRRIATLRDSGVIADAYLVSCGLVVPQSVPDLERICDTLAKLKDPVARHFELATWRRIVDAAKRAKAAGAYVTILQLGDEAVFFECRSFRKGAE